MNRRSFSRALAGATLGTASLTLEPHVRAAGALAASNLAESPFKVSVMLWTILHDLPFEARLEKVAEAGYHAVELVRETVNWTADDFRRYNRKRTELGMTFDATCAVRAGIADPGKREVFLADVREQLQVMDKLECPSLIVTSGNVIPSLAPGTQHATCVENLKRAADLIERKNITLLVENIDLEENPHYYLWSVPEAFKIVEDVNHPRVKFLFDFYHGQISGGNLIANLERHADKLGAVHIADVPGRHEPGTGEINYLNIYRKLAELKFNRYVAMEFYPSGDTVKTLARARLEALQTAQAVRT
jgi:hydroxypyruvate isomerase